MDDTVYRQAAIEAINSHFGFNVEEEYGSAVQEVINGLPPAQPEPRWIPVTERLPEVDVRVLICNDAGRYMVGFIKPWIWGNEWSYQSDMYNYDAYDEREQGELVAWMPLPKPYERGEDE